MRCRRKLLLVIAPSLNGHGVAERALGLPRRGADVRDAVGVREDGLDLLQHLACRLGEQEEDMDEHCGAENPKRDVHLPLDVHKRRGHEVAKRS